MVQRVNYKRFYQYTIEVHLDKERNFREEVDCNNINEAMEIAEALVKRLGGHTSFARIRKTSLDDDLIQIFTKTHDIDHWLYEGHARHEPKEK